MQPDKRCFCPRHPAVRAFWAAPLVFVMCLLAAQPVPASDARIDEVEALLERHKDDQAEEILRAILQEDATNPEAYALLARVHLRRQEQGEAVEAAEKAVELDETVSGYRLWLARSYLAKALDSGVINAFRYARKGKGQYEEALVLDSTNVEARFELCMYLLAAPGLVGGDKDRGIEQAGIIERQDSLYGAYAWAAVHERDQEMEKAETCFHRAVELDTSSTYYARYALGYFYERNERYDDAVSVFKDILARKPDEMNAVFQVGKICIVTESDLDEAEQCFKRYLEVEAPPNAPDWAAAHWRLGMVYDLQGRVELALEEVRKAVELAPNNKEFRKTLTEIEKKARK